LAVASTAAAILRQALTGGFRASPIAFDLRLRWYCARVVSANRETAMSRTKLLTHLQDNTLWTENDHTRIFQPDKFQIFDGQNNIASDLFNFTVNLTEITANGTSADHVIVDYDLHNHSWNHAGDEYVYFKLYGNDGGLLFEDPTFYFGVGRAHCDLHHNHPDIPVPSKMNSIYDLVFGIKLTTFIITNPIGSC
jgi:hypothetical protein